MKKFKSVMAIALAVSMLVPGLGAVASESITVPVVPELDSEAVIEYLDTVEENYGHLPSMGTSTGLALEESNVVTYSSASASKHKSKYDPRTQSLGYKLPEIRNQGQFGTCWAHAVVGALEVSTIKNYKVSNKLNLSELELVSEAYYHPR